MRPAPETIRLLIVEDEALIADELQMRLQQLGHQVAGICDTADAAVALARQDQPDLVLMDIRLKGRGDGIEAAERIYGELGIPVVYLTAHSDRSTFARARAGAAIFGYLIKPVQERELVIAIDVALQRQRRTRLLREHALSSETVVRELADGVVVIDGQGVVSGMNRTAEVLCGWHAEAAMGQPLAAVLHLEAGGHPATEALLRRLAQGDRAEIRDATMPRGDGRLRSVWVTAAPVVDHGAGTRGAVIVLRDTEDREVAAAAQRASRAKTEFLSRMSHEVRTPLNAMLGFTELLMSDADDALSASQRARVELVLDAARHLRALIDDVMDVSLIEAGHLPVNLGVVPLRPLLDSAQELCALLAQRHGVRLLARHEQGSGELRAQADPVRLRQALVNVLSNAIKYNRRGGSAWLGVRVDAADIVIEIRDDGMGMTAAQLEHVFEPFNRLGREHGGVEGTGLGLCLTRQLLQRMGGDVQIDSVEGQGTRVQLRVPAAEPAAAPAERPLDVLADDEPAGQVLYIEDNPVNTLLVEQFVRRWPAVRMASAETGQEGLARAAALRPDLILLDMNLPDMDGVAVLERLRAAEDTRGLRVVALSASVMPDDIARARNAGAEDYLTKPLDFAAFERGLRRGLARRA